MIEIAETFLGNPGIATPVSVLSNSCSGSSGVVHTTRVEYPFPVVLSSIKKTSGLSFAQ